MIAKHIVMFWRDFILVRTEIFNGQQCILSGAHNLTLCVEKQYFTNSFKTIYFLTKLLDSYDFWIPRNMHMSD